MLRRWWHLQATQFSPGRRKPSRPTYRRTRRITYPTNKGAMHNGSSVGIHAVHADFACLAQNCLLSRHLLTIMINIVLCCAHLHVRFGIKSYAQLALVSRTGMLLPFLELSWKFIVSWVGSSLGARRVWGWRWLLH